MEVLRKSDGNNMADIVIFQKEKKITHIDFLLAYFASPQLGRFY